MCTGRVKLRCVAVVDGGGQGPGGRIVLRLSKIAVTMEGYTEALDDITPRGGGPAAGGRREFTASTASVTS